ncbi:hypothetical protein HPB51_023701 [Rhipicephalus microplus]|uniref:Uncharacterized protein n=1 Tax=Rhipicephalus microplus TaxID=6941 RepID=A0A9J6FA52_RHIMP|nr:hypothetical protein HPB51_023701 [Rhipicephalus microplus]
MVSEPKPHQVNRKRQNLTPDPFATLQQLGSPVKAPAPSRSPSGQPAPSVAATRALPRRNCTRTPSRMSSSVATTGRCFRVCRSCSTTSATAADCASPAAATWSGSLWPTRRLAFRCPSALNARRAAEVGGSWPATLKLLMGCPSATMHPLEAATNTDEHDPKSLQSDQAVASPNNDGCCEEAACVASEFRSDDWASIVVECANHGSNGAHSSSDLIDEDVDDMYLKPAVMA